MTWVTDPESVNRLAAEREPDNEAFRELLRGMDSALVDSLVFRLNETVSAAVDCTACGNCCKTLLINVTEDEAARLARHLERPLEEVKDRYLEQGMHRMVINAVPCHFLSENKCTVYTHRFDGCREFPALHLPGFTKRLFTIFMHYDRCPIIFNVVESLKDELGFENIEK